MKLIKYFKTQGKLEIFRIMKYMLNSICRKIANMRNNKIVKFLFTLLTVMYVVPSFAETVKYKITAPTAAPLTYTGKEEKLVYGAIEDEKVPGKFVYSLDDENSFVDTIPAAVFGKHSVFYKYVPTADSLPATDSVEIKCTISPKQLHVEWADTADVVYDGDYHKPTVTLEGKIGNDDVEVGGVEQFREAGTYIITAELSGSDKEKYYLDNSTFCNAKIYYHISRAVPIAGTDFIAPTAKKNLSYNGKEQELVNVGETVNIDGTFVYALSPSTDLVTEIPIGKNPGKYTVKYRFISRSENYESSKEDTFSVTIAPSKIYLKWTNETHYTYNGSLQGPTAEINKEISTVVEADNVEIIVTGQEKNVGENYFAKASLSEENASKYEISNAKLGFKILPKPLTVIWGDSVFTYDGNSHKPTASLSGVVKGEEDLVSVTVSGEKIEEGNYTATATLAGTGKGNYTISDGNGSKAFSISQA